MPNKRELEEQIAKLTAAVDEMRARLTGLEGAAGKPSGLDAPRSRRDLLRMGGAAALGAVGAAALRGMPAMAATGGNFILGNPNAADTVTALTGTGAGTAAPNPVLDVTTSDFVALPTGAAFPGAVRGFGGIAVAGTNDADGVDGFGSGTTSFGVYGLTDSGTGVTGEARTGVSVFARGTGRIRQDTWPTGAPPFTPNLVEQARDASGALWLSNAAGNWRRATTFEVFPNPRRVYGVGVPVAAGSSVTNIDATTKIPSSGGGPSGVPAGASAAWCAVQSIEPAVLSIYPAGSPNPNVGTYGAMGTAGISVQITYMMVPLNATGQFSFKNMKTKARIYFDVWGYLTQAGG
jgi:hypothetical protein